jgi:hypothetical protein
VGQGRQKLFPPETATPTACKTAAGVPFSNNKLAHHPTLLLLQLTTMMPTMTFYLIHFKLPDPRDLQPDLGV